MGSALMYLLRSVSLTGEETSQYVFTELVWFSD